MSTISRLITVGAASLCLVLFSDASMLATPSIGSKATGGRARGAAPRPCWRRRRPAIPAERSTARARRWRADCWHGSLPRRWHVWTGSGLPAALDQLGAQITISNHQRVADSDTSGLVCS